MEVTTLNRQTLINTDRLNNADRVSVARLCVSLFDRLQAHPLKEEQVLALAGAFILLAKSLKVEPQDAFVAVGNLMTDRERDDALYPQFAAMAHYLKEDVTNG